MGINPAVYIANYYLFYYELCFIQQLVHLVTTSNAAGIPVSPQAADIPVDEVLQVLQSQDRGYVDQHVELHGQAGMFLLHQYRCTVRFVDDLTSGPNPFTAKLLYKSQTCMGGLIHGIYPGQFLVLDATPGDRLFSFNTLDVQIVTDSHLVVAADGSVEHMIKSHSLLFDKRRLPCYADIPIVQFTHVSSSLSLHCGYNTLIGQLHRFRELITVRGNYVLVVARLMLRMNRRGYKLSILRRKLKHHMFPDTFGDTNGRRLFSEVQCTMALLAQMHDWEVDVKHLTGWQGQVDAGRLAALLLEDEESELSELSEIVSDMSELSEVSDLSELSEL